MYTSLNEQLWYKLIYAHVCFPGYDDRMSKRLAWLEQRDGSA